MEDVSGSQRHHIITWTMPGNLSATLASWEEAGWEVRDNTRWRIVPPIIWWTVWKERNSRCFENRSNSLQKIKVNCILLFCFWCRQAHSKETVEILDVLDSI
uniref:Putative ovule protein n=1 Tax=Solanum chacoense TaxID=4108 RepID=A0A0V0IAJ9_SOLCH